MNIVSTVVGLGIASTAMPMVAQMAITPAITQVRATNFGVAETSAVTYAALNEGKDTFSEVPNGCELEELGNEAYTITCTAGEKFEATIMDMLAGRHTSQSNIPNPDSLKEPTDNDENSTSAE